MPANHSITNVLSPNCSFFPARKKLMAQANKALFALNYIPIDLQLKLFYCLITPILLYSSEIWSYENINFN